MTALNGFFRYEYVERARQAEHRFCERGGHVPSLF